MDPCMGCVRCVKCDSFEDILALDHSKDGVCISYSYDDRFSSKRV